MTRRALVTPLVAMVLLSLAALVAPIASNTSPILGLDLQGGFSVVLEAKEVDGVLPSEDTVEQAKEIIRQRVDGLGVAEPDITRQGRTVIVQLPGVRDRERAEELVGCTARLEFRPVVSRGGLGGLDGLEGLEGLTPEELENLTPEDLEDLDLDGLAPDDGAEPDTGTDDGETGQGMVGVAPGEGALPAQLAPTTTTTQPPPPETVPDTVPETTEVPTETTEAPTDTTPDTTVPADVTPGTEGDGESASCVAGDGTEGAEPIPLDQPGQFPDEDGLVYELGPAGFTGEALSRADATLDQFGTEWQVSADVRGEDRTLANESFNACFQGDAACPGRAIAIVLDGIVLSAPTVNAANLASDTFIITGDFSEGEAKDLALVLRYGSLPVEFDQAAQQQVSASLGADSLRAGLVAGLIGLAVLALYMVLYYRGFGLVVVASLLVWGGLMYGLINFLSATQGLALTLAGITGIIVSIGTTVDTYVVIFERVNDEVRGGRSVKIATERGYQRGIRTVLTANAAAFIGAFLLWYLTVGPVRGFAYFLGISVILDLFVAILFTRPLMLLLSRSPRFADARFFGVATAAGTAEPKAVVS